TFLGATGTVTGSKYLLTSGSTRLLVDCGLFQGFKALRLRNWAAPPVNPSELDAVVLTHAHLDHSGYLPLLVKRGFSGRIYCTTGTRDLCAILLPDSGHLQEEDAAQANKHRYSRHTPALPLYTQEDAVRSLSRFFPIEMERDLDLGDGVTLRLSPAGHILGSSLVSVRRGGTSLLLTGDLGRPADLIMKPPAAGRRADYLVIESTYGDHLHDPDDPEKALAAVINRTIARGGVVVIPSFAVGRTQTMLYALHRLKAAGTIPEALPVFLDSPMAVEATDLYVRAAGEHRLSPAECRAMGRAARFVNSVEESKQLDGLDAPMVLISASGMATGGRVLHHLKVFAPEPRNTILFVGFQAGGTRGEAMINGAAAVKIHGAYVPVRAEVVGFDGFSAHADAAEMIDWLKRFEAPPKQTFITHGEPAAADALRRRIEEQLGWRCRVPDYLEKAVLG
ncbi:MAG: MBL fold metallo-hydrolase, partial [Nitrospirae bacterium]|nr:MBL fold metallo-hydrolase [Nitrospirota bacterium]